MPRTRVGPPARAVVAALVFAPVLGLTACTGSGTGAPVAPAPSSSLSAPSAPSSSPAVESGADCAVDEAGATCLADRAVAAVVDRLSVMPDVAHAKVVAGAPIQDRAREREVRRAFVSTVAAEGVARPLARGVISDQIDAATNVQTGLVDAWRSGSVPSPTGAPKNLVTQLRPRIDAATDALARVLVTLSGEGVPDGWETALADAQGRALPTLPTGVTAVDLTLALTTLSQMG